MLNSIILLACISTLCSLVSSSNSDSDHYLDSKLTFEYGSYFINLIVGSHNQSIPVIIDTGSSDLWLPTNVNPYCNKAKGFITENAENIKLNSAGMYDCQDYPYFNFTKSSTFKDEHSKFENHLSNDEVVIGTYGRDNIIINGKLISNMTMGISNFTNSTYGYLGLGHEAIEASNNYSQDTYPNLPAQLADLDLIKKPAYSLYLAREGNPGIIFGALDSGLYSGSLIQFENVAVDPNENDNDITQVAVSLDHITIIDDEDYKVLGKGYYPAVLDVANSYLSLPQEFMDAFVEILDLNFDENEGAYVVECVDIQSNYFMFSFQGEVYTTPAASYFEQLVDNDAMATGVCYFNAVVIEEEYIKLGSSFLKHIYTVVDLEAQKIAFANIRTTSTSSNIKIIDSGIPDVVYPDSNHFFDREHNGFTFGKSETLSYSSSLQTKNQATGFDGTVTVSSASNKASSTATAATSSMTNLSTVSSISSQSKNAASSLSGHSYISIMALFFNLLC